MTDAWAGYLEALGLSGLDPLSGALLVGLGLAAGLIIFYLSARPSRHRVALELAELRARIKSDDAIQAEREAALAQAEQRLAESVGRQTNASMARQSDVLLKLAQENFGKQQEQAAADLGKRQQAVAELVKPLQETLARTQAQIAEIEKERQQAYGSIRAQLATMAEGQSTLRSETQQLVKALRRPEVRGRWGELTLRRTVELAGMVEHCDFNEQAHTQTDAGAIRPDLIVQLPERGQIVVDVKTPLDAYLDATEANDDQARSEALRRHARNMSQRVRELAAKSYWAQFDRSPEFVVLFVPGDQFLAAALNEQPELMEDALRQRVILATPSSLIGLLKAVAFGWRQLALADNAEQIRQLAVELHQRLGGFTNHLVTLGKRLDGGVKAYNEAIGSLERMVLPGARKFTELGIPAKTAIPETTAVERSAREPATRQLEQTDDEKPANDAEPGKPH